MSNPKLKPEHAAFVAELMKDPERAPGPAYARVYSLKNDNRANISGRRLMRRADVIAELERQEALAEERRGITPEETVREITLLAKADPRDLFEVRRGACRYCHGQGHLYQRTPQEFRDAWADYMANPLNRRDDPNGLKFDHRGGVGFNPNLRPHPECPECFGDGEVYEHIKDSRDWTPGAARLFAGLQRTRDGLKVSTRSQDRALNLAAQMHQILAPAGNGNPEDNVPPPSEIVYEAKDASKPGRKR